VDGIDIDAIKKILFSELQSGITCKEEGLTAGGESTESGDPVGPT
jgi:hypothetical protein